MKISIRKMFVLLAIVMSVVAVPAVWAIDCSTVVEGVVTEITETGAITVDYETTVYGVPVDWGIVAEKDNVVINAYETNKDKLIACYLTVNGGAVIELRPRNPETISESTTEATLLTDSGALNCNCHCLDETQDCHCVCGEINKNPN